MNSAMERGIILTLAAAAWTLPGCSDAPDTASQSIQPPQPAMTATEPVETAAPVPEPMPRTTPAATPVAEVSPHAFAAWKKLTTPGITPAEWDEAHQELIDAGAAGVPVLNEALQSRDPMQREIAVGILMLMDHAVTEVERPLLTALADDSAWVRANAATALCTRPGHEDQVIPVLAALLTSDDPQLRQLAATNLSNFGPEAGPHVAILATALDSAAPDVLLPIVELLGRIGPDAAPARSRLQQIAFETESEAATAAHAALERIDTAP